MSGGLISQFSLRATQKQLRRSEPLVYRNRLGQLHVHAFPSDSVADADSLRKISPPFSSTKFTIVMWRKSMHNVPVTIRNDLSVVRQQ